MESFEITLSELQKLTPADYYYHQKVDAARTQLMRIDKKRYIDFVSDKLIGLLKNI